MSNAPDIGSVGRIEKKLKKKKKKLQKKFTKSQEVSEQEALVVQDDGKS